MAESTDTSGGVGADTVSREVAPPPGGTAAPPAEQQPQQPVTDNNDPNQQPVVVSSTPQPRNQGPSRQDIMSAIEALPERFISGVREAFPGHPAQVVPQQSSADEQAANLQQAQSSGRVIQTSQPVEQPVEPDKKTFVGWWFG